MAKAPTLCPRCNRPIRRVSMTGGTIMIQGHSIPDPDQICITLHKCGCTSCKGSPDFQAFLDAFKAAYGIP
jgi:hypothetical protein